jgi:uncharacterized membrane protein
MKLGVALAKTWSSRSRRRLPAAVLLVCAYLLLTAGPAWAKDYSLAKAVIEARIQPNGDVRFTETRTFSFRDGVFRFAYQDLSKRDTSGFSAIGVSEGGRSYTRLPAPPGGDYGPPGTFLVEDRGREVRVTWYYEADSERTFTVNYTAGGAAKAWADTAEFYWQLVGSDWTKAHDRVTATVHLPPYASGEPRAWGHGPLNGKVEIVDQETIRFEVDHLPAGQFLEGRVLFPAAALPAAPKIDAERLPEVLAEERAWAEEANRRRLFFAATALLAVAAASAALISGAGLYWFYGREYQPTFTGDYYRELPAERPPSEVAYLVTMGNVPLNALAATFMDLGRRGYLRITDTSATRQGLIRSSTQTDYTIELLKPADQALKPHEVEAVHFLFGPGPQAGASTGLKSLEERAKQAPETYRRRLQAWEASVKAAGRREGLIDPASKRASAAAAIVSGAALAAVVGLFSQHQNITLLVPTVIAAALPLALIKPIKRRSRAAAEETAKWEALRRFLLHFSKLNEAMPSAVALWEHFLVYATALGVARQVIDQLKVRMPPEMQEQLGTGWFVSSRSGAGPRVANFSGFSAMPASLSGAVSAAKSASSPSGGGGGFSGGGGRGGGGGGGGAG